jgi:hypothetical protein
MSGVGLEIVHNDNRHAPPRLRTSHRSTHLLTKDISRPSRGNPAIKPTVSPVHQPKAVDLAIIAWRFHQALPAPPFPAPDPGEGRMKGKLYLVLQVEIGSREQRQEFGHIGRKLTPQISFNQVLHG